MRDSEMQALESMHRYRVHRGWLVRVTLTVLALAVTAALAYFGNN